MSDNTGYIVEYTLKFSDPKKETRSGRKAIAFPHNPDSSLSYLMVHNISGCQTAAAWYRMNLCEC